MGGSVRHGTARSVRILEHKPAIGMSHERKADAGFECLPPDITGLQDVYPVGIRRRDKRAAHISIFRDGEYCSGHIPAGRDLKGVGN